MNLPNDILTPESQQLFQDILALDTNINSLTIKTWKYMCLCFDAPRPSAKEEIIRNKLIECTKGLGLTHKIDQIGNLAVLKPASIGYETKTRIAIQAHMDMVCSKSDQSTHNFDTDRIPAKISTDQLWVLSGDTTLGCDNGIGVAAGFALLDEIIEKQIPTPQIELLITVEEETTMAGALNAHPTILHSPQALINCDSEEHMRVCLGCAGGGEVTLTKQFDIIDTININNDNEYTAYKIFLGGFNGGHSGVDIHKNRGNAIQVGFDMIDVTIQKFGSDSIRIAGISGGNAVNAIPRNVEIIAAIKTAHFEEVQDFMTNKLLKAVHTKYALTEAQVSHPDITIIDLALDKWSPTLSFTPIYTTQTTFNVLSLDQQKQMFEIEDKIPHGVIDWSKEVPGFVETSNSFSIVTMNDINNNTTDQSNSILFHCFFRSTKDQQLQVVATRLQELAKQFQYNASNMFNDFPGWQPAAATNPLLTATGKAYQTTFGTNAPTMEKYVIHAGLESGCIAKVWPSIIQVSIGPTILDAHSFYEKIEIVTVQPFVNWLWEIVANLTQVDASEFPSS